MIVSDPLYVLCVCACVGACVRVHICVHACVYIFLCLGVVIT